MHSFNPMKTKLNALERTGGKNELLKISIKLGVGKKLKE